MRIQFAAANPLCLEFRIGQPRITRALIEAADSLKPSIGSPQET